MYDGIASQYNLILNKDTIDSVRRVQSDDLRAMAVVLENMLIRIDKKKKPSKEQKLKQTRSASEKDRMKIWVLPQLPVDDIIRLIMDHFKARGEVHVIRVSSTSFISKYSIQNLLTIEFSQKKLQSSTTQMRLLERRLFAKLDDKKSNALNRISSFLKLTHQQVLVTLHNLENANSELIKYLFNCMNCAMNLYFDFFSWLQIPNEFILLLGCYSSLRFTFRFAIENNWGALCSNRPGERLPRTGSMNCLTIFYLIHKIVSVISRAGKSSWQLRSIFWIASVHCVGPTRRPMIWPISIRISWKWIVSSATSNRCWNASVK